MMGGTSAGARMPEWESGGGNFDVGVSVAPDEGQACEPVFGVDGAADTRGILGGEKAGGGGEFRAGDFPTHRAGSDLDLRIIANALDLAQFAVGHEIQFAVFLGKPDRGINGDASLAEGGEREVVLSADFGRDGHDLL